MKSLFAKSLFTAAVLLALSPAQAATQDLDKLLSSIKDDIAAQRLSSPAGNNALERIDAFRAQAPFDFRVVPLTYKWGEAYVAMAEKAIGGKEYEKAQQYLDKVWLVAALTPGLEEAQAKLDSQWKGAPVAAAAPVDAKADAERQKKLAEAAEKEKAKVEAERKRKAEEDKRLAAEEKKKADQERARKQEEERLRRAEAEKAEKAAAEKRLADAQKAADKERADAASKKAAPAKVVAAAPVAAPVASKPREEPKVVAVKAKTDAGTSQLWTEAKEDSAPIASYPVSSELLTERNRDIVDSLEPVCKAILDNDASVVVHTQDKADYRWLTVRLTLCMRRLDKSFRLRHSYEAVADGAPFVTLHPAREVSLVRKVGD
ncbi:hypothetical protein ACQUQU_02370 [Thalassolituus sp. LLYu03]|uniref:hypothetical protein n=1 Tax=Thalassolituus sp. LLYu03 TaxID=3421656 RepID=UPI003D2E5B55